MKTTKAKKGGFERATFTDCCILNTSAATSGVDGGDCSQHEIVFDLEGTSSFEVTLGDGKPVDANKLTLRFRGDAEARCMEQACQKISQFFLKHEFHKIGGSFE